MGDGSLTSLKLQIEAVMGVRAVTIYENCTDRTVDDIPPRAVHIIVDGGDDTEIAHAIHDCTPIVNCTYGNITIEVGDGFLRSFSRPQCRTCNDLGWVIGIEGASSAYGMGGSNECQVDCPDCNPPRTPPPNG